jgi:hypothetical protein
MGGVLVHIIPYIGSSFTHEQIRRRKRRRFASAIYFLFGWLVG